MQPLKTLNDIDIFINDSGQFYAKIQGKTVKKTSLKAIEKAINEQKESKKAIYVGRRYSSGEIETPQVREIAVKEKSGRFRNTEGHLYDSYVRFLEYDPSILEELKNIAERHNELVTEWQRVLLRAQAFDI